MTSEEDNAMSHLTLTLFHASHPMASESPMIVAALPSSLVLAKCQQRLLDCSADAGDLVAPAVR